ncbi:MAG: type IV pilin protein [bacterium]
MKNRRKGFTLIELLIVVAIIAILAAIAIPNFLSAQVRSKVSRAKSDMRTIATGMESYYVENNAYPCEFLYWGRPVPYNEMVRIMKAEALLTTPIAYLTSFPMDPFKQGERWSPPVYWYYNWQERYGYPINYNTWVGGVAPWYDESAAWVIDSIGPDYTPGFAIPYDPTNGTVTNGDIVRLGPGGGGAR